MDDWGQNPSKEAATIPGLLWAFGEHGRRTITLVVDGKEIDELTEGDIRRIHEARSLFPEANIRVEHFERLGPTKGAWWEHSANDVP
jgi:hypothetical protein